MVCGDGHSHPRDQVCNSSGEEVLCRLGFEDQLEDGEVSGSGFSGLHPGWAFGLLPVFLIPLHMCRPKCPQLPRVEELDVRLAVWYRSAP